MPTKLRFVLHEHSPPAEFSPDQEPFPKHWDLMIEQPNQPGLATWRLAKDPTVETEPIQITRLPDHRAAYLEIESAAVSNNRGHVTRRDVGQIESIEESANDQIMVRLHGEHLQGEYLLDEQAGLFISRNCNQKTQN